MFDICALVEAEVIQIMAIQMFGSFFVSVVHDKVMETSYFNLALFKDHFDVCALVAKGFQMLAMGMFKSLYASVVHGKVLEMFSLYLALHKIILM